MKSAARLELKLLGGFEARLQAGAALVLPTQKTQALLAYLALRAVENQEDPAEAAREPALRRRERVPRPLGR